MARTRQYTTLVRKHATGEGAKTFMQCKQLTRCTFERTHGRWRVNGGAYAGITRMFERHLWSGAAPPRASAATKAVRGTGSKAVGVRVGKQLKAVLCAKSAAAAAKARKTSCGATRSILDALEAEGVVITHVEEGIYDVFARTATGVDLIGLDTASGKVVLVEVKVFGTSPAQFTRSAHKGTTMMRAPLDTMEDSLLNRAVCQLLWAHATLSIQYTNPATRGLVIVASPSGGAKAGSGAGAGAGAGTGAGAGAGTGIADTGEPFVYWLDKYTDQEALVEHWDSVVRPFLSDPSSCEAKKEQRAATAKARRKRKREDAVARAGIAKTRPKPKTKTKKRQRHAVIKQ